jgi:hypothetical protein
MLTGPAGGAGGADVGWGEGTVGLWVHTYDRFSVPLRWGATYAGEEHGAEGGAHVPPEDRRGRRGPPCAGGAQGGGLSRALAGAGRQAPGAGGGGQDAAARGEGVGRTWGQGGVRVRPPGSGEVEEHVGLPEEPGGLHGAPEGIRGHAGAAPHCGAATTGGARAAAARGDKGGQEGKGLRRPGAELQRLHAGQALQDVVGAGWGGAGAAGQGAGGTRGLDGEVGHIVLLPVLPHPPGRPALLLLRGGGGLVSVSLPGVREEGCPTGGFTVAGCGVVGAGGCGGSACALPGRLLDRGDYGGPGVGGGAHRGGPVP